MNFVESTAFRDLGIEYIEATTKFPGNNFQFAALIEEVGELAQALMEQTISGKFTSEQIYKEAIQVATMAMRVAIEGSKEYKYCNPNNKGP